MGLSLSSIFLFSVKLPCALTCPGIFYSELNLCVDNWRGCRCHLPLQVLSILARPHVKLCKAVLLSGEVLSHGGSLSTLGHHWAPPRVSPGLYPCLISQTSTLLSRVFVACLLVSCLWCENLAVTWGESCRAQWCTHPISLGTEPQVSTFLSAVVPSAQSLASQSGALRTGEHWKRDPWTLSAAALYFLKRIFS